MAQQLLAEAVAAMGGLQCGALPAATTGVASS
jgi:hypothetical protein